VSPRCENVGRIRGGGLGLNLVFVVRGLPFLTVCLIGAEPVIFVLWSVLMGADCTYTSCLIYGTYRALHDARTVVDTTRTGGAETRLGRERLMSALNVSAKSG